jgi:hypothetical protein
MQMPLFVPFAYRRNGGFIKNSLTPHSEADYHFANGFEGDPLLYSSECDAITG